MKKIRTIAAAFALTGLAALAISPAGRAVAAATTAAALDSEARQSLDTLYRLNPAASSIGQKAKAILVFPNIVKAGLIFGGAYGEGVLLKGDEARDYYSSVAGSYGVAGALPAGARSYGYTVFLMTDTALNSLDSSDGWEFGLGPTLVLVDQGTADTLPNAPLQADAYVFVYGQQGLMAGIGVTGTKVSKIRKT